MGLYETKVNMTLTRDSVDLLAGDTIELDDTRAANINEELRNAFPTLSPVLVPVHVAEAADELKAELDAKDDEQQEAPAEDDTRTKDELKAELDAKGIEYPKRASKDELLALLNA